MYIIFVYYLVEFSEIGLFAIRKSVADNV